MFERASNVRFANRGHSGLGCILGLGVAVELAQNAPSRLTETTTEVTCAFDQKWPSTEFRACRIVTHSCSARSAAAITSARAAIEAPHPEVYRQIAINPVGMHPIRNRR